MEETWKIIKDFENYQVSNLGRVKGQLGILKPQINPTGYYQITIFKKNNSIPVSIKAKKFGIKSKPYNKRVHRLVLETFCPVENMKNLQVNHKDCNKLNNNLSNLEWVTCKENVQHIHKNKEINHPNSQICYDENGNKFKSYREAGKKYNISSNIVKNDVLGITKRPLKNRMTFSKQKPKY